MMNSVLKRQSIRSQNKPIGSVLYNQSGQGVVEYLLVMIVTITLILGVVYQLNDAFGQWAKNYFGEYLSCIIETGELPSLGGNAGGGGECNEAFEAFSIANGRPLIGDGDGGGPGGSGGGSSGGGGDGSSDGGTTGGTNDEVATGGNSGRGATFVNRSRRRGGGFGGSGRFSSGDNSKGEGSERASKKSKTYTGSTEASIPGYALNNGEKTFKVRGRRLDYGGGIYGGPDEEESLDQNLGRAPVKRDTASTEEKKRSFVVKKVLKKETIDEDEPMTFGGYLRYLIIAAIIIALVLFFGSQVMQLSNSMD